MKKLWRKIARWFHVYADNRIIRFQLTAAREAHTRLAGENARFRTQVVDLQRLLGEARHAAEDAKAGEAAARLLLESERGISAERLAEIDRLQELNRRTIVRMEEDAATIERLTASVDGTKARPGFAIYPPRSANS